jgi:hypothetical protein
MMVFDRSAQAGACRPLATQGQLSFARAIA